MEDKDSADYVVYDTAVDEREGSNVLPFILRIGISTTDEITFYADSGDLRKLATQIAAALRPYR